MPDPNLDPMPEAAERLVQELGDSIGLQEHARHFDAECFGNRVVHFTSESMDVRFIKARGIWEMEALPPGTTGDAGWLAVHTLRALHYGTMSEGRVGFEELCLFVSEQHTWIAERLSLEQLRRTRDAIEELYQPVREYWQGKRDEYPE